MGISVTKESVTKKSLRAIGIFGGTFDPVHRGHITLALELQNHLQLDVMFLMPCRVPPHRAQPSASDDYRLQMLQLATANTGLQIDARELTREGPSYTVDSLKALRRDYGTDCAIVLCMGMDAFTAFTTWHDWQQIPQLAHIAVVQRPDVTFTPDRNISDLLNRYATTVAADLTRQPAGKIYLTQLSQIPVSSTAIRQMLATGQTIPALHPDVYEFIQRKGLYRQ